MSDLILKFKKNDKDTGSLEVQVVQLTEKISSISEHIKRNAKDHSSQRGLMKLVGQRRRFLNYLQKHDRNVYEKLISTLNLRK
ncbi:30S ribosomal protein S15 [Candidatus Dependentiae bacterium]|nr:30S ribosomal protein S15 [Candidatus Dependentiae bacterium]